MSGQPVVLQVVILRDGLLVGTEVLIPGSYALGSAAQCDLRLDDPSIAPKHATLYFQNGKAAIQDAGSPAGIYVNGHKVTACQVRSVDEIACGPFVLKTKVLSQKPAANQPPPEIAAFLQMTPAQGSNIAGPTAPSTLAATVAAVKGHRTSSNPAAAPKGAPANASPNANKNAKQADGTMLSARRVAAEAMESAAARFSPANVPPAVVNGGGLQGLFGPPLGFDDDSNVAPPPPPSGLELDFGPSEEEPVVPAVRPIEFAPEPQKKNGRAPATPPRPVNGAEPVAALELAVPPRHAKHAGPKAPWMTGLPKTVRPVGGKGKSKIYFELYWGDVRREARSFRASKKPIVANSSDQAMMPLYGFAMPDEGLTLSESSGESFRVFIPVGAQVERCRIGQPFAAVEPKSLDVDNGRRFVLLADGEAARFTSGQMSLVSFVSPTPNRVWTNPLRGQPYLLLALLSLAVGGFVYFLGHMPDQQDNADFAAKGLAPVAVRLLAPQPKKKEEAKKKLEELKAKAPKKEKVEKRIVEKVKQVERAVPKQVVAAPETKALKALAKLSAAGPANKDILAAVDKLGNGPGSKFANNNFRLSGLIGKAPIANAGLGTFGLGGGGRGGIGTMGAEILRGKGGGGIGAIGAGKVGKGSVGGTVAHATARAVMAQGNIDKEGVAKVVNSHLQEVRGCYERALLKDPGLAGKVTIEWAIGLNGRVASVKTKSSSLKNGSVEGCIMNELKTWQFPTPHGGQVIITYPFLFNSVGY